MSAGANRLVPPNNRKCVIRAWVKFPGVTFVDLVWILLRALVTNVYLVFWNKLYTLCYGIQELLTGQQFLTITTPTRALPPAVSACANRLVYLTIKIYDLISRCHALVDHTFDCVTLIGRTRLFSFMKQNSYNIRSLADSSATARRAAGTVWSMWKPVD